MTDAANRSRGLTADQLQSFASDGYLILPHVLSDRAVSELREAASRVMGRTTRVKRERKANGVFDSFRNCIALSDRFLPLLAQPIVLAAVVQLMGPNIRLTTSQLIFRYPDPKGSTALGRIPKWHRDMAPATEDLGHDATPLLQIKCAYLLTDCINSGRGATLLVPGSNHAKVGPLLAENELDPKGAVEPSMAAGDCLLFENRTWHAGGPNLSSDVREMVVLGYGFRWLKAHDFNVLPGDLAPKLNELELFLMGESPEAPPGFRVGGGRNPIREWFAELSVGGPHS